MKLKIWEKALVIAVVLVVLWGGSVSAEASELSDKLIRLHVVANSDSDEDQALKLKVRDSVLEEMKTMLKGAENREEAEPILERNLEKIAKIAEERVRREGYDYNVSVTLGEESFPTTEYDTFALPAGIYESLRIVIGEGGGHNWWCVVFPPVCTLSELEYETASAVGLSKEEIKLIKSDSQGYVIKFRTMEFLGKLKSFFF